MPKIPLSGISMAIWTATAALLGAEVVTLHPVADTTLFEFDPDVNFGRQRDLPGGVLGLMGDSSRARVLYRFDVEGELPPRAEIEAARMTLSISRQIPEAGRRASDFALSRVLVDWGEGVGFGERPGGRPAEPGEATWNFRFHPESDESGTAWSQPGGEFGVDFATELVAMARNVDGSNARPTSYHFEFNETGLEDLQSYLDGTVSNHGWVLYTLFESTRKTARRWTSREAINEGPLPELEITYTLPATPPPKIVSLEIDPGGQKVCVRVVALGGYRYQLEWSDNLADWTAGDSQAPAEDAELVFSVALEGTRQFVRVRRDPIPEVPASPPAE